MQSKRETRPQLGDSNGARLTQSKRETGPQPYAANHTASISPWGGTIVLLLLVRLEVVLNPKLRTRLFQKCIDCHSAGASCALD